MKTRWAKLACSTLVLATLAIGCTPTANLHPDTLASSGPKATKLAARSAARARLLLAKGMVAKAIAPAEIAVAAVPENVGYRVLLGEIYLQAGRFSSAQSAFGEALTLDPANPSAGLNLALAQSALGKQAAALATLNQVRDGIAPVDLGLALALAGAHKESIDTLAAVARGREATPKARQNLAFALALAGRWAEAHAVAGQDLDPNELDARMRQWALLASPKSSVDQVASVLGVHPAADPGEPTMLALAAPAAPVAAAAAAPVVPAAVAAPPVPVAAVATPAVPAIVAAPSASVATAVVAPVPAEIPAPVAAPAPIAVATAVAPTAPSPAPAATPTPAPVMVAAAAPAEQNIAPPDSVFYPGQEDTTFVAPSAAAKRRAAPVTPRKPISMAMLPAVPKLIARRNAPKLVSAPAWPHAASGGFVVQLGAFSRPESAQAAWAGQGHYLQAAAFTPSSMTFVGKAHRQLFRLSIAGFRTHDDALTVCLRIRARGGHCFVRAAQGDQLASWFKSGTAVAVRGPVKSLPMPAQKTALRTLPVKPVSLTMPARNHGVVIALR